MGRNDELAKIKTLAKANLFHLSYHGDRDTSSVFQLSLQLEICAHVRKYSIIKICMNVPHLQ